MTPHCSEASADSLFSEALMLAEGIDDPEIRSGAFTSIGIDLFQSGREEKALRVLQELENPKHRSALLWDFTVCCAYHDRIEEMERFRSQLENEQREGTATPFGVPNYVETQIHRILAGKNEDQSVKIEMLEDAASTPIAVSFDDPVEELIHHAFLSKRDLSVAKEKLEQAFGILQSNRCPTERRFRQLETILYALVEFHDPDVAMKVQEEIERSVRNTEFDIVISDDGFRREAMKVIIAQGYANEDRVADALALARGIECVSWRATTISAVARIMEAKRRDPDFDITETM